MPARYSGPSKDKDDFALGVLALFALAAILGWLRQYLA